MTNTITDIKVKTTKGEELPLENYKGNVLLIVNVASKCGFTPQYASLEEINKRYRAKGLRILGFPCNDYGAQEPGTNEEIAEFCSLNYGVSFEMFDKVHAKGPEQHPLYARLTEAVEPKEEVKWNFEKFLINKNGEVVSRYNSKVKPDDVELTSAIETELAK